MAGYVTLGVYPETREKIRKIAAMNYRNIADQIALLVDLAYAELEQQRPSVPHIANPTDCPEQAAGI